LDQQHLAGKCDPCEVAIPPLGCLSGPLNSPRFVPWSPTRYPRLASLTPGREDLIDGGDSYGPPVRPAGPLAYPGHDGYMKPPNPESHVRSPEYSKVSDIVEPSSMATHQPNSGYTIAPAGYSMCVCLGLVLGLVQAFLVALCLTVNVRTLDQPQLFGPRQDAEWPARHPSVAYHECQQCRESDRRATSEWDGRSMQRRHSLHQSDDRQPQSRRGLCPRDSLANSNHQYGYMHQQPLELRVSIELPGHPGVRYGYSYYDRQMPGRSFGHSRNGRRNRNTQWNRLGRNGSDVRSRAHHWYPPHGRQSRTPLGNRGPSRPISGRDYPVLASIEV